MTTDRRNCDYCGLMFSGNGFSPGDGRHFCCYGCYLVQRIIGARPEGGIASWLLVRLGAGAFLSMNVMMISLVLYTNSASELGATTVNALRWAMLILSAPAVVILGGPFIAGAFRSFSARKLSTDALITTGAAAAFLVSSANVIAGRGQVYFDTATMLLFLVTVGRLIEASAKNKTSKSIRELLDLTPSTARVRRDGIEREIPSSEVQRSDCLIVHAGERIPADGHIVAGRCLIEESAFTGESAPRSRGVGDLVCGGSINCDGLIEVEATAVGTQSLLSQIRAMIERAERERAPVERLTERVSTLFVPTVWAISLSAGLYWWLFRGNLETALMSALAVLVVACPCALGLATPMATCFAIGRAARSGALIRSGTVLELLPRIACVLFDKTGTLTENELVVSEATASNGVSIRDAVAAAASLERFCSHSIARAIISYAEGIEANACEAWGIAVIAGQGVKGVVEIDGTATRVAVGSLKLLLENHRLPDGVAAPPGLTAVYVGWDREVKAVLSLESAVRQGAREVIAELQSAGIHTAIVSGDLASPTSATATALGIDQIWSECSPSEKADTVRAARKRFGGMVAMVGDGINDAPALAEADVGIAVGGGTDLAREASDITLLGDDLSRIPSVLTLSRLTYRVIRQNLFWAFAYNCAAIVLAFLGYVHPLIAASAMVVSSLAVIGNSLRLLRSQL